VTWNLKGSISGKVRCQIRDERIRLEREPKTRGESARERRLRHDKLVFAATDKFLDSEREGPLHLREPACAQIVEDSILTIAGREHLLWAWCVMANHVHMLITPHADLWPVMQRLKGGSAMKINRLQNQTGRTFWQDESYDHWA